MNTRNRKARIVLRFVGIFVLAPTAGILCYFVTAQVEEFFRWVFNIAEPIEDSPDVLGSMFDSFIMWGGVFACWFILIPVALSFTAWFSQERNHPIPAAMLTAGIFGCLTGFLFYNPDIDSLSGAKFAGAILVGFPALSSALVTTMLLSPLIADN